ncbi:MAG TPA: hypothetical protein VI758_04830 [Bacteroidota bacterium]
MERSGLLETLEEKVVFRVSRFFFLTLAIISMLALLIGVFYLGWSLTPSTRGQDPKPLVITAADVKQHIETTKGVQPATGTMSADTAALMEGERFNSYIDTLRQLLPSPVYSWDASETLSGGQYVSDPGIAQRLDEFSRNFADYRESNIALSQLCSVLREFPPEGRLKPLESFIALYTEQLPLHKEKVDKVESDFQENQLQKASGKYESLVVIASAISTMAFLAIFLVLLSVQRNIKMLAAK